MACVLWSHWRTVWTTSPSRFPAAELAVETFFVISGFLITGILLDNRLQNSQSQILKQFYIRRFLRIFPLHYLVLLLGLVVNADSLRESWCWQVFYLSNIYFYLNGWHGYFSHFWSLAVEEQFYLFWPLLIICLARRFQMPAIIAIARVEEAFSFQFPCHSTMAVWRTHTNFPPSALEPDG